MKQKEVEIKVDSILSEGKNISGRIGNTFAFEAIVNNTNGGYGITNGKVIKLEIYGRFKQNYVLIYDKKWIKKPSKENIIYYNQVMRLLKCRLK
ncbi:DUF7678 domain-containing protein [Plebeiibacterium sediminum]|uniref:DUF7678 domain-containing protein n=1 Tax=Plebeiibacterium sediminum TaxID=2992112 RepID=A0AAE3M9E5_9BACT|nr:hypothetical protein [Plebeiobacterium sediminum]MCW3789382.1 hypothetical protein [Plebeiobacterium sediminum]